MDITSLTISTARAGIQSGQFTGDELTSACLRQIERLNPTINAFITICDDVIASRFMAKQFPAIQETATARNPRLAVTLAGIPLAVKDLYETARVRTTAGTPFFKDYIPEKDAFVVEKLKNAGATILGKTNTHEIALGLTGVNPHFGAVRNPWDTSRITGGSSSGSAAAVAAGMCLAALGTDTGGSIRVPASLCGVVGLKPTYGRVSLRGIFPLSWNLDHSGPLTKTVEDAALLLQVLAGYDELDPACADVPVDDYLSGLGNGVVGWKIALATGAYVADADAEVLGALEQARRRLHPGPLWRLRL